MKIKMALLFALFVIIAISGLGTERPPAWAQAIELQGVPNLHRVSGDLYRSAQPSAQGMMNLKNMGIRTVINLRSFHSDRDEIGRTGLDYERLTMKTWHIDRKEAVRFLQLVTDPHRAPVLVHCQHGSDRTGAMCALYRVTVQGWSKEEAIREMSEGGFGFHRIWANLKKWLREIDVPALKRDAGIKPHPPANGMGCANVRPWPALDSDPFPSSSYAGSVFDFQYFAASLFYCQ